MTFLIEHPNGIAIRQIDLDQPWQLITNVADYTGTRIFVFRGDCLLGHVDIANYGQAISIEQLQQAIPDEFTKNMAVPAQKTLRLPANIPVSIVVATYDRPDDLRNCLACLLAQETARSVEIIVVDNNPASGCTPPVVVEFPGVVLVNERRQGLAYARNAGFLACRGQIAVATDDDVTVPPDWLEKLLAPFTRPDVMIVTGNTLPIELETYAQCLFEEYGGLGKGYIKKEVGGNWFRSFRVQGVPTWRLGATANAAFRTAIFSHPQIGLMDEALGPGMPSGVGEDTYLFYKVLKADYTLVYEPNAYVWHRHRRSMEALHRQLYNYSKGHIAYHLTTMLRDYDIRGLLHILLLLPPWRALQVMRLIAGKLRGRSDYSLAMWFTEIMGHFAGPWNLWQSHRRVKREGRSESLWPTPTDSKIYTN